MREPSVTFVVADNYNYLIVNPPDRSDTFLITIDPIRGYPNFSGFPNVDIFENEQSALNSIKKTEIHVNLHKYYMIGGIFNIGNAVVLCFVTKVKFVGKMFNKHNIYEVQSLKYWVANKIPLKTSETKAFSELKTQNKGGFFICHTKDLSVPLQGYGSISCIWNLNIMKPFNYIKIGTVCPLIIHGSFSTTKFGDFEMYNITRFNSSSCLPVKYCRGTNKVGVAGNSMYTESILAKNIGESYQFKSFILFRSTTPITFVKGHLQPDKIPHSSLPVYVHSLIEVFNVETVNIVDLGHCGCKKMQDLAEKLKESVDFVKESFDVNLFQFDWRCSRRKDFGECISSYISFFDNIISTFTFTSGFIDNEKLTYVSNQKQAVVITSPNGLDVANIGTFFSLARLFSREIGDIPFDRTYNHNVVDFIAEATIKSGDILAKYSQGTESISHNDINSCVSKEKLKTLEKQNETAIYALREKKALNDDIKVLINTLFNEKSEKLNFKISFPAVSTKTRCVSHPPVSFVITPKLATSLLYHKRTVLDKSDGPIVIALTEPCYISEFIINLPSADENLSMPSSFTMYGGNYINRMFPIFENAAIPIGEKREISYKNYWEPHYSHESSACLISCVRFISIEFDSPFPSYVIDGLKIYGKQKKSNPYKNKISSAHQQVTKDVVFDEELNHETSLKWEERRLNALMPLNDYLIKIAERGINPGFALSGSVFRLHSSALIEDATNVCCICGEKANFRCGLCRKKFCTKCSNENDSHDQMSDPNNRSKLCNECSERRYKLSSSVTRLSSLKTRMEAEVYPFLFNEESEFYSNSPMVLNQVPCGENKVVVEKIISNNDPSVVWCPEENSVRVDFVFKQKKNIKEISIACKSSFIIFIEDKEPVEFSAPGNTLEIGIESRIISILFVGDKMSISGIHFATEPVPEVFPVSLRVPDRVEARYSEHFYNQNVKYTIEPSQKLRKHKIVFASTKEGRKIKCYGIDFNNIEGIKKIMFCVQTELGMKHMIFSIPTLVGGYSVFFPESLKCLSMDIWYIEYYQPHFLPSIHPILY